MAERYPRKGARVQTILSWRRKRISCRSIGRSRWRRLERPQLFGKVIRSAGFVDGEERKVMA
jgi:hypothetical protein